ncbi:MAG: helix-turn-helix domain-containing protein [bacterium]
MNKKNGLKRWDNPRFQRISAVKVDHPNVFVHFEDGTVAEVEADKILPPDVHHPQWERLSFNSYELLVPAENGNFEISWSTIRVLTDAEYSAYMAKAAEEQARKIGQRLKALRTKRGMKSKELAERAGITPQSLSRIENGKHDVVFKTLQKILGAMGYALRDLSVEPDTALRGPRSVKSRKGKTVFVEAERIAY